MSELAAATATTLPMPSAEQLEARERRARVGELELVYEELGDPGGEPLLLIMGLGTQMIHWDEGFCERLGDRGFRVIRFDNRDAGRSSRFVAPPSGRLAMLLGLRRNLAYTLDDMAGDAAGLLGALELDSAHVAGASMGGMIAQVTAYRHPERVRSLTLIMSGAGKRTASIPRLRALGTLLARAPRNRDAYVALAERAFRVIGSPGYEKDWERFRELAGLAWDRGHNPAGVARQLHAITASGDRTAKLKGVRAPTVVLHGERDPLVRPAGGRALAQAIPGARLRLVPGMGHDLPAPLWPQLAGEIAANAARARSGARVPAAA